MMVTAVLEQESITTQGNITAKAILSIKSSSYKSQGIYTGTAAGWQNL